MMKILICLCLVLFIRRQPAGCHKDRASYLLPPDKDNSEDDGDDIDIDDDEDLARYLVGRRPTTTPGEVSSSDDDDPGESISDDDDDDDENDDEGDDQYTEYLIISNTTLELTSDIVPQTRKSSMTTTPVSDDGNTQDASDAGVEGDVRLNGTADNAGVEGVEVDFRISGTGGKQLGITARNNSDTDDSRNVTTKVDEPIVLHATTQTVVAAIGENTNFLLMVIYILSGILAGVLFISSVIITHCVMTRRQQQRKNKQSRATIQQTSHDHVHDSHNSRYVSDVLLYDALSANRAPPGNEYARIALARKSGQYENIGGQERRGTHPARSLFAPDGASVPDTRDDLHNESSTVPGDSQSGQTPGTDPPSGTMNQSSVYEDIRDISPPVYLDLISDHEQTDIKR